LVTTLSSISNFKLTKPADSVTTDDFLSYVKIDSSLRATTKYESHSGQIHLSAHINSAINILINGVGTERIEFTPMEMETATGGWLSASHTSLK
jgi:hypothetical protein